MSVSYFLYCVLTFLALLHQTHGQTCVPGLDYHCVNETAFEYCLNGSVVTDYPIQSCSPAYCYDGCVNFCTELNADCIPAATPATTETATESTTDDTRTSEATTTLMPSTTQTTAESTTEEFSTTGITTITTTMSTEITTELNTEETSETELTTTTTTIMQTTRPPTAATTPMATTSAPTDAPPTEAPFTCESAGEFQDLGNCSIFYLCIPLSSGDFVYIKFSCPDGSQFDSVTKKCSQNATCIRPSCNEFGFYCISTSQVQLCYDSEPPSGDAFRCPANTYCNMDCQYPCWADLPCTVPTESPSISTTTLLTSTVTLPWTTSESPLTSTTAFPTTTVTLPPTTTDYSSTTTTTLPTSTLTSPPTTTESSSTSTTALPTSTVTVPPTTTEYPSTSTTALPTSPVTSPPNTTESSATSTTTSTTSTTTSPTPTVTLPQTTTAAPFICSEAGKFPHPTNCSLYYVCSPKSSGGFYTLQFSCPASSLYNPSTKQCSSSFTCPYTDSIGTTASSEVTSTSRPFTCEESGRFADPADCKSYYVCSPKSSGGFYELHYQCPPTSAFNPNTRQCSKKASVNCAAA